MNLVSPQPATLWLPALISDIVKPNPKYLCIVEKLPTEPKSIKTTLQHPG